MLLCAGPGSRLLSTLPSGSTKERSLCREASVHLHCFCSSRSSCYIFFLGRKLGARLVQSNLRVFAYFIFKLPTNAVTIPKKRNAVSCEFASVCFRFLCLFPSVFTAGLRLTCTERIHVDAREKSCIFLLRSSREDKS